MTGTLTGHHPKRRLVTDKYELFNLDTSQNALTCLYGLNVVYVVVCVLCMV